MKKICKYDNNNWLMQDENKNLLLLNEKTNQIFDLQSFIQPERSKREESMYRCSYCGESWHTEKEAINCNHCGNHRRYAVL